LGRDVDPEDGDMRHRFSGRSFFALMASLTLVVSACGTDGAGGTTTTLQTTTTIPTTTTTSKSVTTSTASPETTTTEAEGTGLVVYFLLEEPSEDSVGPFLVPVHRDMPVGENAAVTTVESLLAGPSADEMAGTPAISTAIPEGTTLLEVEIADGVATVDLSQEYDDGGGSFSMFARLAQVVFTVTRVADVHGVQFEIEGEPVSVFSSEGIELDVPQGRDDYLDLLPPIFVDEPAWGQPVTSPISVNGLSNVFEAVSQVMLTDDDGASLFEETVTATCGTGCWGNWESEITYAIDREQFGALIVWEYSAKDGSRINVREYPVRLGE
jgi:spore germination protein GerM